jgi:hypothetical protein
MFEMLYLFLIRHKQICLPEIGLISLQIQSAKKKFIDREVLPPVYFFTLSPANQPVANKLFTWLSHALGISETEAIARFNDFAFEIKKQLQDGKEVIWKGVGKFSKGLMNEIEFESEKKELSFQQAVVAEKVIREHARHTMLVGEKEKTGSEYSEIIEETKEVTLSRPNWWIWPVALIVLSLIFIGWYFSENGIRPSSSSNTEKLIPKDAPPGF